MNIEELTKFLDENFFENDRTTALVEYNGEFKTYYERQGEFEEEGIIIYVNQTGGLSESGSYQYSGDAIFETDGKKYRCEFSGSQ